MITRICTCFKIKRQDGVLLGFTDHDQSIFFENMQYFPHGGFDASSVEQKIGASVDSLEAQGFISDDRITEQDLRNGLYDNALIEVFEFDWLNHKISQKFQSYRVADISMTSPAFQLTIESDVAIEMARKQGRIVSGNCPFSLGDKDCGVVTPLVSLTIQNTNYTNWIQVELPEPSKGIWRGGMVKISEHLFEISRIEGNKIFIYGALPPVLIGSSIQVLQGCDKSFATCQKFNNQNRFGGFPHTPTQDHQIRIAKQGDGFPKNGGSIFETE